MFFLKTPPNLWDPFGGLQHKNATTALRQQTHDTTRRKTTGPTGGWGTRCCTFDLTWWDPNLRWLWKVNDTLLLMDGVDVPLWSMGLWDSLVGPACRRCCCCSFVVVAVVVVVVVVVSKGALKSKKVLSLTSILRFSITAVFSFVVVTFETHRWLDFLGLLQLGGCVF